MGDGSMRTSAARRVGVRLLLTEDGKAKVRSDFVGGRESFQGFLRAIAGAVFLRGAKGEKGGANVAPLDRVPGILKRLREPLITETEGSISFDVSVDRDLRTRLYAMDAQRWLDYRSADARVDQVDAEIYARTGQRVFPFQKTGALELATRTAFLLADDMGTGKTRQIILALPAGAPVLVVGTASAKLGWASEMRICRPNMAVRVLSGKGSFRWPAPGEMVVVNYDVLPHVHAPGCDGKLPAPPPEPCKGCREVVKFVGGGCITTKEGHEPECTGFQPEIPMEEREDCRGCAPFLKEVPKGLVSAFDEAHRIKNRQTLRGSRCIAISDATFDVADGRVWLATGTPLENDPRELYSVLEVARLGREAFGSWGRMIALFGGTPKTVYRGGKEQKAGYEWRKDAIDPEVPFLLQRVMLRRTKADVLPQLPGKMWRELEVDIDTKTMKACEAYLKTQQNGMEGLAARLEAALSSDTSPKFEEMSIVKEALAKAKIPAMLELVQELEDAGQPALVFSMHRSPIDVLERRRGWAAIHGGLSGESGFKKRQQIVERFQAGKLKGLALTIQAGGEALTLTRASQVIFVDLSFVPSQNEQAEDRAYRLGQNQGVVVTILKGNHPLDKRITEILIGKRKIIASSVDAASNKDHAHTRLREVEDRLKMMQEEIARGGVLRRIHSGVEEERIIEVLAKGVFVDYDERLARDLAEQAVYVGLTEKQWALAADLAQRARVLAKHLPEVVAQVLADREEAGEAGYVTGNDAPITHSPGLPAASDATQEVHEEPAVTNYENTIAGVEHLDACEAIKTRISGRCTCGALESEERAIMAGVDEAMKKIRGLSDEQREALLAQIDEEFCPCGAADRTEAKDQHECTLGEDDDNDEDENEGED